ncbi:hypothetical protein [Streptomyces sp. NPDC047841]|uniref:hypothetical protein n=1 Tax=Streptomyces sp. NPDC047841 TaxID=3154708 RepID=UPI003456B105
MSISTLDFLRGPGPEGTGEVGDGRQMAAQSCLSPERSMLKLVHHIATTSATAGYRVCPPDGRTT